MKTQDFNFYLPTELIAQYPTEQRTSSRLLYLDSTQSILQDAMFSSLPNYLRAGDVMVFNDTQVIKARLFGKKATGGKVEIMIERILDDRHVLAVIRASHAPKPDSKLILAETIPVTVITREQEFYTLRFEHEKTIAELLECYGQLPLPPYINRPANPTDEARYQTVYAKNTGAVAAPTAGLHFDIDMINQLEALGAIITYVTLHVGAGTFQPVRVENIADHSMHRETFYISQDTIDAIQQAKTSGRRILAVGTTTLRALGSLCIAAPGAINSWIWRYSNFYYTWLSLSSCGKIINQFPSTLLYFIDVGLGFCRHGKYSARLSACCR